MIKVSNLNKDLAGQTVLNGVNLEVEDGEIMALLGASGSGKSVLLRNIVGLMRPDSGSVNIDGKDVHASSKRELISIRDRIGMLFQGGALFDSMTVYDNLAFPLREKTTRSEDEIESRVHEQLDRVGMQGSEKKYPAELSGGMQKRVALARSLILNPEIIFFDEPTTGLDPLIANSILRLIKKLHTELQFSAIIVTHNFQKVFDIVQMVAMLHKGEIVAHDTPDNFLDHEHPAVKEFVREAVEGPLEASVNESNR